MTAEVVAAYRGHVWVDRSTYETLRITMIAADLPAGYPIQVAGTFLDYDYADLSGHSFLVPKRALVMMQEGSKVKRNQIDFSQYRKFTTDTKISFDPPPQPPR